MAIIDQHSAKQSAAALVQLKQDSARVKFSRDDQLISPQIRGNSSAASHGTTSTNSRKRSVDDGSDKQEEVGGGSGGKQRQFQRRKRTDQRQLTRLTEIFTTQTDIPSHQLRDRIGAELDMTNREVQVWFQNRRAKVAKQRAEMLKKEGVAARDMSQLPYAAMMVSNAQRATQQAQPQQQITPQQQQYYQPQYPMHQYMYYPQQGVPIQPGIPMQQGVPLQIMPQQPMYYRIPAQPLSASTTQQSTANQSAATSNQTTEKSSQSTTQAITEAATLVSSPAVESQGGPKLMTTRSHNNSQHALPLVSYQQSQQLQTRDGLVYMMQPTQYMQHMSFDSRRQSQHLQMTRSDGSITIGGVPATQYAQGAPVMYTLPVSRTDSSNMLPTLQQQNLHQQLPVQQMMHHGQQYANMPMQFMGMNDSDMRLPVFRMNHSVADFISTPPMPANEIQHIGAQQTFAAPTVRTAELDQQKLASQSDTRLASASMEQHQKSPPLDAVASGQKLNSPSDRVMATKQAGTTAKAVLDKANYVATSTTVTDAETVPRSATSTTSTSFSRAARSQSPDGKLVAGRVKSN